MQHPKGAHQQASADEQHHAKRDFSANKKVAYVEAQGASIGSADTLLQGAVQVAIPADEAQCRQKAGKHTARQRYRQGKQQHCRIEAHVKGFR